MTHHVDVADYACGRCDEPVGYVLCDPCQSDLYPAEDVAMLRWLHAEAAWRLQVERDRHVETIAKRDKAEQELGMVGHIVGQYLGVEITDPGSLPEAVLALVGKAAAVDRQAHEERSSRQAWADEALRWREYAGIPAWGGGVDWLVAFGAAHHDYPRVCACISDDQAALLGPGFSRPVCAVHEQKDASDA